MNNESLYEVNRLTKELQQLSEEFSRQSDATVGKWDWDIVTNELLWSDEIYVIFGLSPKEFGATYEAFLNSVHPEDREKVKEAVNEALYCEKPYSITHRIVRPDGSIHFVHEQAEVYFNGRRKPVKMMGTVQLICPKDEEGTDVK